MTALAMRTRETTVQSTPISTPLERGVHTAALDGVVHATPLDRTTALFEGITPRHHRHYRRSKLLHPQWMRTLEEKYQRLHMKITRSTSSMKQMYNSAIGRAVIDQRLVKANVYNKTIRDQSVKDTIRKRNNKICAVLKQDFDRKIEEDRKEEYESSCEEEGSECEEFEKRAPNSADDIQDEEIRSSVESVKSENEEIGEDERLSEARSVSEIRAQNDRVDSNNNYGSGAERVDDKVSKLMNGDNTGNRQDYKVTCDNNMNARSGKKAGLRSNKKNVNIIENVEHAKNNRNKRAAEEANPKVIRAGHPDSFITQLANHMNSKHSPAFRAKTSNSKISTVTQKTSKSCPATMDGKPTPVQSKLNTVKSVPTLRAKTAGSRTKHPVKVFSRMSQEAQHALSETMKEKSIPKTPEPEVQDYATLEERVVWEIGRPSIEEKLVASPRLEQRRNRNTNYVSEDVYGSHCEIEDIIQDDAYSDTDVSMQTSRRRPISTKTNRTRLPFIPAESPAEYYTLGQLKHLNYRLPGIGRYEIATLREKTFEITPPGYDIRYNDIAVFEEGEMMELPSSDIRDKAVQKCTEWLSRYTPRYATVQSASVKDAS